MFVCLFVGLAVAVIRAQNRKGADAEKFVDDKLLPFFCAIVANTDAFELRRKEVATQLQKLFAVNGALRQDAVGRGLLWIFLNIGNVTYRAACPCSRLFLSAVHGIRLSLYGGLRMSLSAIGPWALGVAPGTFLPNVSI